MSPGLQSRKNREDKSPALNIKYRPEEEKKLSMDDFDNEEGLSIENVDDSPGPRDENLRDTLKYKVQQKNVNEKIMNRHSLNSHKIGRKPGNDS